MSLNVQLVNMPFAGVDKPSIALTQLKQRIRQLYPDKVEININYLNHDFARLMGQDVYQYVGTEPQATTTGIGDWLFRQSAFPELADNKNAYLGRFGRFFEKKYLELFERASDQLRLQLDNTLDQLIAKYRLDDADIVGMTSMFSQHVASIALAKRLRRRRADQVIVLGGANCEGAMGMELIANVPDIDFVFSGPSLISFPEFVGKMLVGNASGCHEIDGVLSRRNCQSVVVKSNPGPIEEPKPAKGGQDQAGKIGKDLDINIPIELDYDDYFSSIDRLLSHFSIKSKILFETSRGCWWGERSHCTFCGLNGHSMAYRAMRPDVATDMLTALISRYSDRTNVFWCVDNILPREYVDTVFSSLRPPEQTSFFYEVKPDLSEAQLHKLAGAGVNVIQPGIESFSTSTLKLMGKGATAIGNVQFLKYCEATQIKPTWNLVVGFPGESPEDYVTYQRVLPDLVHLPPPIAVFPVRFDRFSPYFNKAKEYGLRLEPLDYYGFCYPFSASSLANIAYFFQDTNYGAKYILNMARGLSGLREVVHRWQDLWAKSADPRSLLKMSKHEHGCVIEDRRSGKLSSILISQEEVELLAEIESPVSEESVLKKYGAAAVESVRRKRLVFSERGRIVSLMPNPRGGIARETAARSMPSLIEREAGGAGAARGVSDGR